MFYFLVWYCCATLPIIIWSTSLCGLDLINIWFYTMLLVTRWTLARILWQIYFSGVDFYLKCIFVKSQEIKAINIYFTFCPVLAHSNRQLPIPSYNVLHNFFCHWSAGRCLSFVWLFVRYYKILIGICQGGLKIHRAYIKHWEFKMNIADMQQSKQ